MLQEDLRADPLLLSPESDRQGPFSQLRPLPHAPLADPQRLAAGRWDAYPDDPSVLELWQRLQCYGSRDGVDPTPTKQMQQQLASLLIDPDAFRAGGLSTRVGAWVMWFRCGNWGKPLSTAQQEALSWIADRVRYDFVGAPAGDDTSTSKERSNRRIVLQMLAKAAPGRDPETLLAGTAPGAARFPNHASTEEYASFVDEEIAKLLATGAVAEWTPDMGAPTCINGLRVAAHPDKPGKLRLVINPMYANLHMRIQPIKYDTWADVVAFLRPGDFMVTTDDKSGYHNLLLHPDMYGVAAFESGGRTYYYRAMAFGFAPACRCYTVLKQELYRPLRALGVDLAYLIDDCLLAARTEPQARFLARAQAELLTALGFTLSPEKCMLAPARRARFLGFNFDAERSVLEVPPEKVAGLERLVRALGKELAAQGSIPNRQVARVAGKIIAMTPAVSLAPLHARMVGRALTGQAGWDEAVGDPEYFLGRCRLFLELLGLKNGRTSWAKRATCALRLAGDASEIGVGGVLPGGELGGQSRFCIPFSAAQLARMAANDFSSTERELEAMMLALLWVEYHRPELVRSCAVQYQTDSQAAHFCVLGQKGKGPCLAAVDRLLRWCAERDVELLVVWYPREAELQKVADSLSKDPSLGQWGLAAAVFDGLWGEGCLAGRQPSVDLFADEATAKLPRFYAAQFGPTAEGIDAFSKAWGGEELAYVNPPLQLMARVVRKIVDERVDCVLVAPVWPRAWAVTLQQLTRPDGRHPPPVRARRRLQHSGLYERHRPGGGTERRSPRYAVEAWYIIWGR